MPSISFAQCPSRYIMIWGVPDMNTYLVMVAIIQTCSSSVFSRIAGWCSKFDFSEKKNSKLIVYIFFFNPWLKLGRFYGSKLQSSVFNVTRRLGKFKFRSFKVSGFGQSFSNFSSNFGLFCRKVWTRFDECKVRSSENLSLSKPYY